MEREGCIVCNFEKDISCHRVRIDSPKYRFVGKNVILRGKKTGGRILLSEEVLLIEINEIIENRIRYTYIS